MTTTLDIITEGYRESNLIGIGVTPNTAEQTQGLARLNAVVSGVFGFEVGEQLANWPIGTVGWESQNSGGWNAARWSRPWANMRLVVNNPNAETIYLPRDISDGARIAVVDTGDQLATYPLTLRGNGNLIEGAAEVVLNEDSLNRTWLYRADLASWERLTVLELDSEMPFPVEFDDAFITMLAMRLNPRYGRAMSGESGAWMQESVSRLRARYKQKVVTPADLPVLVMSVQAYQPFTGPFGRTGRFGWMV